MFFLYFWQLSIEVSVALTEGGSRLHHNVLEAEMCPFHPHMEAQCLIMYGD